MKKTIEYLTELKEYFEDGWPQTAEVIGKIQACLDEIQAVKDAIEKIKEGDVEVLPFDNEAFVR
jgi:prefoldin subunit 5